MQKVTKDSGTPAASVAQALVYWLAASFVIIGLLNVTPAIPGWDDLWKSVTGIGGFKVRRFPTEYLYPLLFLWMMVIVALHHSMWRSWRDKGGYKRNFGLFLDLALVIAGLAISFSYLIELEAVCLIDIFTGDRARLMAEALQSEIEYSEMMGLPIPETADDPACLNTTADLLPLILFGSVVVFLAYNIKVWGLPLVIVSIIIAAYTFLTVMNWYFFGADGQNKYLVTILSSEEVRSLTSGREFVRDALVNNGSGLLGRFINILMLLVFPYIILGALFGQCAGGKALIKLAFSLTRNLRGGPAHAAVVSSAMFGTITGGPVVNVLSTGVLTIPMMLKRGFSRVFAGGVEAAASSGGSIMPPIMGVAAFIMAARRTAFGTFGGALKSKSPTDLAAVAASAAIESSGFSCEDVDSVVMGNVSQTCVDTPYLARHVGLRAGVPESVPALTVNRAPPPPCLCPSRPAALTQPAGDVRKTHGAACGFSTIRFTPATAWPFAQALLWQAAAPSLRPWS